MDRLVIGFLTQFLIAAGVVGAGVKLGASGGLVLLRMIAFVLVSCALCLFLLAIPMELFVVLFTGHLFRPLMQAVEYFVLATLCVMALGWLGGKQSLAFFNQLKHVHAARSAPDAAFHE